MTVLDWHAERSDLHALTLLERAPESEGIDLRALRLGRRERLRGEMAKRGVDALLLSDPINIRYASGARNMQVFTMRNAPTRYQLLTADRAILFEFAGCQHLADGLETLDEVRPAFTASFVAAGHEIATREKAWAAEMAALVFELTGKGATLGLERLNAGTVLALQAEGLRIVDAQESVERARAIKSTEEIKCIKASLRATELAVGEVKAALRPGITENELWSHLHRSLIAQNGDYVETRLLNSGPRSNPWFQESSSRRIEANELVALDTDIVGCHGYYSDFSRSFHSGPKRPSVQQRTLYNVAYDQVHHNMAILKPGLSFRDYAEQAWTIPERYHANRYYVSAHGVGMTGEYPYLYHRADFPDAGYDGAIEPGMTLCVESYIGEAGGKEGVKLEQQLLITETGTELLSHFPFEEDLLG